MKSLPKYRMRPIQIAKHQEVLHLTNSPKGKTFLGEEKTAKVRLDVKLCRVKKNEKQHRLSQKKNTFESGHSGNLKKRGRISGRQ